MNHPDLDPLSYFPAFHSDLHGVRHWAHVAYLGHKLGNLAGLSPKGLRCVTAFAWCHDLWRPDDGPGNEHAHLGATGFRDFQGEVTKELTPDERELVTRAIHYHADGQVAALAVAQGWFDGIEMPNDVIEAIVGCCWDADRLDLLRLGIEPQAVYFSTPGWAVLVELAERINGL